MKTLITRCALGLLLSLSPAFGEAVETTVVEVKGDVTFAPPNSTQFQKLNKGERLKEGSKIKTGADGAAIINPFAGSAAQIGANSDLTLTEVELVKKGDKVTSRRALLDLRDGSVITSIDPKAKADFRVRTPKAIAKARGTAFSVNKTGNGSWTVVVAEGSVQITLPGGQTRTVSAGSKIVVFADGTLSDTSRATGSELAAVEASQQAAVALNLLTGEIDAATQAGLDVGVGAPLDGDLILINPANISGEVSPEQ